MSTLKISYSAVNSAINELHKISAHPEEVYVAIGKLRAGFSSSNSECANELVAALDKYQEVYSLVLELCNNSADMLRIAKLLYSDMDAGMSSELSE